MIGGVQLYSPSAVLSTYTFVYCSSDDLNETLQQILDVDTTSTRKTTGRGFRVIRTRPGPARCHHARVSKEGGEESGSRGQASYYYFASLQFLLDDSLDIGERVFRAMRGSGSANGL